MKPRPEQRWLLITSAYHMPRALDSFRRAGFHVSAYAVDYRRRQGGYGVAHQNENWAELRLAIREWGVLIVYRLLGRTDALVPGPG